MSKGNDADRWIRHCRFVRDYYPALSPIARDVWVCLDALDSPDTTRKHIANLLRVTERHVGNGISELKTLGLLETTNGCYVLHVPATRPKPRKATHHGLDIQDRTNEYTRGYVTGYRVGFSDGENKLDKKW